MIAVWLRRFATAMLTAGVVAALLFGRTALAETAAVEAEPGATAESSVAVDAGESGETGENSNGSETAEAVADDAPAAADEASSNGRPSGDVFVPTEEISEDFAVSFPVDI
ncbi:MAG: hypothetical protein ACNA7W_14180 [Pseudomonadales bacterium]